MTRLSGKPWCSGRAWLGAAPIHPGNGAGAVELEAGCNPHLCQGVTNLVHGAECGIGVVLVRNDVERHRHAASVCRHGDALVQFSVQLLFAAPDEFAGGLDQGVEGVHIQRLGVLFVAAHGPGADQSGFGFTVFVHGHGPAIVVIVFDDLRCPAVVAPQAGFLDFVCGCWVVGHGESLAKEMSIRGDAANQWVLGYNFRYNLR